MFKRTIKLENNKIKDEIRNPLEFFLDKDDLRISFNETLSMDLISLSFQEIIILFYNF